MFGKQCSERRVKVHIFSIGHYSYSKEDFLRLLSDADIEAVADVRAFPGSRKFPQYSKDNMPDWLQAAGIHYAHFPKLGGRRKASSDVSPLLNGAWENQSFHNYADYTLTESFHEGIAALSQLAQRKRTVYCCSERHPARCHRLIISNWLATHNWKVNHIIPDNKGNITIIEHELGKWGARPIIEKDGTVVYPE
nr:DUF488 domain-containing protein [Virgibacillus halodenitrificans]